MTAINASQRRDRFFDDLVEVSPRLDAVEILEDVGLSEPFSEPLVQPARVTRSITVAVADEDRRHVSSSASPRRKRGVECPHA